MLNATQLLIKTQNNIITGVHMSAAQGIIVGFAQKYKIIKQKVGIYFSIFQPFMLLTS